MEELNQLFKGFNVLTTPYDKVDNRVITKKNAITLLNQIGGNDPAVPAGTAKNGNVNGNGNGNGEEGEEGGNEEEEGAGDGAAGAGGEDGAAGESDGNPALAAADDKKLGFLEKAKLAAAQNSENDKGTTIPDGKEMMKQVIKIGAIIMYIMLLPLMPWYYVMKHSFAKLNVLYKGVVKPL
jgi:hypothetical protein